MHNTSLLAMSSAKDYAFEIVTSSNQSSVQFLVRNKPSFFIRYLRLPIACLIFACVIPRSTNVIRSILHALFRSEPNGLRQVLKQNIPDFHKAQMPSLFSILAAVGMFLLISMEEPADTLMVMEDMGIQISSKSRWKFLNFGRKGKFVPISEIIDIVIHEGFHGYGQVIYYMCVLTRDKGEGKEGNGVQVIFPNFLPRKEILLQVWKSSRQMLYGKTRRHYRHVPGLGLREVQHLHD
ncbi:hypothetical protein OXX59_004716 [Metschnikowia pulcherrima]